MIRKSTVITRHKSIQVNTPNVTPSTLPDQLLLPPEPGNERRPVSALPLSSVSPTHSLSPPHPLSPTHPLSPPHPLSPTHPLPPPPPPPPPSPGFSLRLTLDECTLAVLEDPEPQEILTPGVFVEVDLIYIIIISFIV